MRLTLSLRRGPGLLYAGVVLFVVLAAFTARSIWIAWNERSGEARAAALFDLVAERTPLRPTDAPGAMAWLRLQLDRFGRLSADPNRARLYGSFAAGGDRAPDPLQPLATLLRDGGTATRSGALTTPVPSGPAASLREQQVLFAGGQPVVVTRRRGLVAEDGGASDRFVRDVAFRLAAVAREIDRSLAAAPLPAVPGDRPPRPVRLYAVSEDGTLASAPWVDGVSADTTAAREAALLGGRPAQPMFAPEEFFFRFDPSTPVGQIAYSGFYLDLGGRGLVSTLMAPLQTPRGRHAVLALDLAFEIDWRALARSAPAPIAGAALEIGGAGPPTWPAFDAAAGPDTPAALRTALDALTGAPGTSAADDGPLRQGMTETGAVAAFQVSDRTWLLMLFPKTAPPFPLTPVVLLAALLAMLFAGFEVNRRRADAARRSAEDAFTEKQNLLDTMQIPLIVVDPNTDVIVSANRAATGIGVRTGARFEDLVWPEARARAHYSRMQAATMEPRRAYGVPVVVRDDGGRAVQRYAIVRSVAVTAPIAALAADERHRLGVLFLLEPEADLSLLADDMSRAAHDEERRRLSGLLSHGVDTLARVLEHVLSRPAPEPESMRFAAWLAEYLERRLTVTAWLFDHWDGPAPEGRESAMDAAQARETIARLTSVIDEVRRDRELRARLHWDNGTLAGLEAGPPIDVQIDWPPEYIVTCPVRGGFGLFAAELVTNAVRHGRPRTRPAVRLTCDRIRKEIALVVENEVDASAAGCHEPYGGLGIVSAMARLFGWRANTSGPAGGRFVSSWSLPASESGHAGEAD